MSNRGFDNATLYGSIVETVGVRAGANGGDQQGGYRVEPGPNNHASIGALFLVPDV